MSEIVATTKVRIEADTTGLKAQAEKEVNAAVPEFKEVKLSLDTTELIKASDAAAASLAATRREVVDIKKRLLELGDARRQAEAAGGPILEAFNRQQAEFAKSPDPTKDEGPLRARLAAISDELALQERLAAAAKKAASERIDADILAASGANQATGALTEEAAAAEKAAAAERDVSRARGQQQGGIGGFLRAGAAGRTGGIAGLIGAGARLGVVGFAATAAFQAVGELQQGLKATGDEAFTTQGKLRNLGSELIGGNFVGGVKALLAEKPVEFDKPLQEALANLEEVKRLAKDTTLTMDELVQAQTRGATTSDKPFQGRAGERYKLEAEGASDALEKLLQEQVEGGHLSVGLAADLSKVTQEYVKNQRFATAAAAATDAYAQALERAGNNAAKLFGPDAAGGPGGIAAALAQAAAGNRDIEIMFDPRVREGTVIGQQRTGRQQAITQPNTSVFRSEDPGNQLANQIRESITSRVKNQEERLRLDVRDKTIVQKQAKAAFDVAKATAESTNQANGAAKEWAAYVLATTGVANATAAANAATKATADEAQDLANQVANAQVAAIADPAQQAQAALVQARVEEAQASAKVTKAIKESGKNSKEANEATAAYQIAVAARQGIENQIAFSAKQAAEAAAESAAASRKAGTEQGLENAITAAALTKRTSDDKKAFDAAIRYWVALRNRATDVEAREGARAKVIDLFQRRAAALTGAGVTRDVLAAKLQNDLAFAQLKGLDTRPFLRALIAFAKQAMDTAVKGSAAFEQARGTWIQAKASFNANNDTLNDLKKANARARAALTESTADDERLIRQDIAYWKRRVAQTKGMGVIHQNAIREELRAEAELKGLVDEIKPTTTVFDLLTEATRSFTEHAGNVINAANRFTADSFTGGIRGQIGSTPNAAGRARLGLDDTRIVSSLDRNTTATEKLTVAYTGSVQPRGHPPAAGATTVTEGSGFGRFGGSVWVEARAARDARAGIS